MRKEHTVKSTMYYAVSLTAAAVCLLLDVRDIVRCRKRGEETGNRLMLECILHTMMLIILIVLVLND